MSMAEALRGLKGIVPWLKNEDDAPVPPRPKSPQEDAEEIVLLSRQNGMVDRQSSTWMAVSQWAASELIAVQRGLEGANNEQAAFLRARARTLRDLLLMDKKDMPIKTNDDRPYIP